MMHPLWQKCLDLLADEITPQHFVTWIRPLQAIAKGDQLILLSPNRFVHEWVAEHYGDKIRKLVAQLGDKYQIYHVRFELNEGNNQQFTLNDQTPAQREQEERGGLESGLNPAYTFETFVEGKSNQMANAASIQVATNPGTAYNPLFIYGGVGLGKTHLMHAVGHRIIQTDPESRVLYVRAEKYMHDYIKHMRQGTSDQFKQTYRKLDALLIDDIQFFTNKKGTQEEFFHTFNELLESNSQIIITADRYPRDLDDIDERLTSRFGWGLTVCIEPPELEMRVAILMRKAQEANIDLPDDVTFFIAKWVRSNVREMEGALKRLIANANLTNSRITIEYTKSVLRDLLTAHARQISIENIQKTVAEYYKIKTNDLLSQKRTRTIARPRQIAMALAKELTEHSLPEIGQSFGGRDHTTVLHACKKINELKQEDSELSNDYQNLFKTLSS
jgi:chromosomal replication initiator protein